MKIRTDTDILNALEAMPFAFEIIYLKGQPKADSVQTLREQINQFLDSEENVKATKLEVDDH